MSRQRKALRIAAAGVLTALLGVLPATGCDTLLEVETDPEVVEGGGTLTLQETMVGAEAALRQSFDEKISFAGLFGDEFVSAAPGPQHRAVDARQVTPTDQSGATGDSRDRGLGGGFYIPLQRLVAVTNLGKERIANGEFAELPEGGTDSEEYATLSLWEGFGKLWLADIYCTVAFLGNGPELTSDEAYAEAEQSLTEAIEASGAPDAVRQAALVGRARVRLILGNESAAAQDAGQVDPGFEYLVPYSTATFPQRNRVYVHTYTVSDWSIAPRFRGLTIDDTGIPDPRTEVDGPLEGFDASQELWVPLKVPTPTTPLRMASGDEAQYIIAEVQGGQTAVDVINEVRARHGISQTWTPSGTEPDEIRDKLIEERFRTLFLEGVHLGDLRRYIDKYDLNLFPTTTPQGLPMGSQTCMPMPAIERENNPDL